MRPITNLLGSLVVWLALVLPSLATDRYAGPAGSGSSGCTNPASPCALSNATLNNIAAGDTLYLRGGTYNLGNAYLNIDTAGTSGAPKTLQNYPGETPILDGANQTDISFPGIIWRNTGNWWVVRGITVKNSAAAGFYVQASNLLFDCNLAENTVRVAGNGGGFQLETGNNNTWLNNDSFHTSWGKGGTGGDGFNVVASGSSGNVFRYNRAWRNNDDGWDLAASTNVLLEGNWSWENGYGDDTLTPNTGGDGSGYKLGLSAGGGHTLRYNLAWNNDEDGFLNNSATTACTLYNNTSYGHSHTGPTRTNYTFYDSVPHILRNNLSANPNNFSNATGVVHDHNSYDSSVTVTGADFVTTSFTANTGARKADCSLPDSNFLKLVSGSDLINAGVNVGLPFNGAAPDIGAYEFSALSAIPVAGITSPSGDQTVTVTPYTLLAGTATDDVGVTSVTVSCSPSCGAPTVVCTPSCGAAATSVSWSVASLPLQVGTNAITVCAFDGDSQSSVPCPTVTITYTPSTMPVVLRLVK